MILSHIDDFVLAGTDVFLIEITKLVEKKLYISKLEDKEFRFTGIEVGSEKRVIELSNNDYAKVQI